MRSLRHRRDLIWHLTRRELRLRYKGSTLGILWSLAVPLAQLVVLTFLFDRILPLRIDGYAGFVFAGLLPWHWFTSCVGSAGTFFVGNRDLVRHAGFEPYMLAVVNILSNLIVFLALLPVLVLVVVAHGRTITGALFLLPLLMVIQAALMFGSGLIIATWNVFHRDVQPMVGVALLLLFYVTPVFYRAESLGASYHALYAANPVAALVESYRSVIFHGRGPEPQALLAAGIASAAAVGVGVLVYRRWLDDVMDAL